MNNSDVYADFLKGKGDVKVFSTKRDVKPYKVCKKMLRKVYPFLLGSAISVTACNIRSDSDFNEKKHPTFEEIYADVINVYKLDKLKDKEPLPQTMIKQIMKNQNVPYLYDINYNHLPENKENFWEIVKNGVKISTTDVKTSPYLTKEQVKMYEIMAFKMLSQISRIKGTVDDVDLSDYNNLKTFNYFERVVKYKDDFDRIIAKEEGVHDAKSEVYGRYYKDYFEFFNKCKPYPQIEDFARNLYKSEAKDKMLPMRDSAYYNAESYKILDKWIEKQNIKDDKIFYFSPVDDDIFCNAIANYYKRGRDIEVVLGVDPTGNLGDGFYAPVGDIIIHELMHVMQTKPSSAENSSDNNILDENLLMGREFDEQNTRIDELGPTFMSMAINDYLYKVKNNIKQDEVVDYGAVRIKGKDIKLGELALWFRRKLEENAIDTDERFSVDKMLAKPQVFNELKSISCGNMVKNYNFYNNKQR